MNVRFDFLEQLHSTWENARGHVRDGLDRFAAQLLTGYGTEHDIDTDRHSTIRATGSISERGRTTPMGEWVNPEFDATAYSVVGAGNSWSVPTPNAGASLWPLSYTLIGKTMFLNVEIVNSSITIGTPISSVSIRIPDDFRVSGLRTAAVRGRSAFGFAYIINNGSAFTGYFNVPPSTSTETRDFSVQRVGVGSFVTSTDFTIIGQVFFEVAL